jgi:hypothetical protein
MRGAGSAATPPVGIPAPFVGRLLDRTYLSETDREAGAPILRELPIGALTLKTDAAPGAALPATTDFEQALAGLMACLSALSGGIDAHPIAPGRENAGTLETLPAEPGSLATDPGGAPIQSAVPIPSALQGLIAALESRS